MLTFGRGWWSLPGVLLVLAIHYVATSIGGAFAFTDWTGIGSFEWVGSRNFTTILEDPTMRGALVNTLLLAATSVVLVNVLGLSLALALNRTLRSRYVLRMLFFMPVVLSPLAISYIWKFIFDYDGPVNAALAAVGLGEWKRAWLADPDLALWAVLLVIVWQTTGIAMVIYTAGLAAVPAEFEEAAALDGAGLWQRFWHVVLPCIRPAVAISTTLGLINGLRIFDQIIALTAGGPAGATETLATKVFQQAFSLGNFGQGAALALLLTMIILVVAIIQQRVTNGTARES
ncbi:sugar ABC transporter permease [Virgisporangium aliadipatigenens]|uniref:Sugar ABC transporter permease n=1 Tax=Virgisporangium aliadipatigenens TaxID=741659 RepID=A0A8J4DST7_9ACTN|nr:sugar ABC transporter permease [Virgisporangium aliadipatigenens]GIJ49585.1 sugar ABC transporter permease [Virgisporangium aliadipatigenens]